MRRYDVVFNLIKNIKNPVGAEIGVMDGVFSINMLEMKRDLKLFSIDPYTMFNPYYRVDKTGAKQHGFKSQKEWDDLYEQIKIKFERYGNRSVLLRGTSISSSKIVEDESLDFVFIDANHLYKYVKEDILTWIKKIKTGGIISGHDYNKKDEHLILNVCKAVDEIFDKNELNFGADNCWWVIKNEKI